MEWVCSLRHCWIWRMEMLFEHESSGGYLNLSLLLWYCLWALLHHSQRKLKLMQMDASPQDGILICMWINLHIVNQKHDSRVCVELVPEYSSVWHIMMRMINMFNVGIIGKPQTQYNIKYVTDFIFNQEDIRENVPYTPIDDCPVTDDSFQKGPMRRTVCLCPDVIMLTR